MQTKRGTFEHYQHNTDTENIVDKIKDCNYFYSKEENNFLKVKSVSHRTTAKFLYLTLTNKVSETFKVRLDSKKRIKIFYWDKLPPIYKDYKDFILDAKDERTKDHQLLKQYESTFLNKQKMVEALDKSEKSLSKETRNKHQKLLDSYQLSLNNKKEKLRVSSELVKKLQDTNPEYWL